jgi:hypothetical protein
LQQLFSSGWSFVLLYPDYPCHSLAPGESAAI